MREFQTELRITLKSPGEAFSSLSVMVGVLEYAVGSKPLWVFLTGPASCGKTFVLRLVIDVYNPYCNGGSSDSARPPTRTRSDVVYEYDRRHPHKLIYVALSRCTDIIRLYLTHAKGDHSFCHARENRDHDLLDEFRRLGSHHLPTFTKAYASRLAELQYAFSLAALNVRSLRLHAPDVVHESLVRPMIDEYTHAASTTCIG
ncbi:hypothetical protein HPB49_013293 [Dermacentor silvarum]|uniref:Uncharacterized protein n=1 Tax=Dermacentor silvarum TaxID=543639 RepID=A0ACB8DJA4_DERSI|nr:hypothetical protein HPB49_013293 [Dermacentor silvarum]